MASELSVKEFYKGRSILVTGGTGFVGKVLVEKLLYAIPDIRRVFLLMREKKGMPVRQRLEDLQRSPLFDRIKNERNEYLDKIIPIDGDVVSEGLGISKYDMAILSAEVSIVFHLAATVYMNQTLKQALNINMIGTQHALNVARSFKRLAIFVHVSTTFCCPEYTVLEETFYPPPADPRDIIRMCECLDEKSLELITPTLLGQHPNTYTYTKRLAESLVHDAYLDLPCVIARPSIVTPAWKEPIPGWVDNLIGPVGILVGASKGVIRSMLCDTSAHAQIIPVDGAVNALIAIAMIEASQEIKSENIPIYNLNQGHRTPTTWGEVVDMALKCSRKRPFAWPLWYPNGALTTNHTAHKIKRILFHIVPAYFIDFLLLITGQIRFMVRVQDRISKGLRLLQYFTMREWCFSCPNFDAVHTILTKEDADLLVTYKEDPDKEEYLYNAMEASRVYVLKEDPAKVPLNRIVHNFMFALDTIVKIVFWCFVLSLFAAWFEPTRYALSFGEPVVKYIPFLGRAVVKQSN